MHLTYMGHTCWKCERGLVGFSNLFQYMIDVKKSKPLVRSSSIGLDGL
jgi:hypothetical protein